MRKLLCLFMCLPVLVQARQTQEIKFEQDLSWEQVKAKATAENKYIFVDCYATWCGPCKKMEKEVFTNDNVAGFINEKFVAVKVQFDQTKKDNEQVRRWYADTQMLKKKYMVAVIPRYLFFFPNGELAHTDEGYKDSGDFLLLAKTAINPSLQYARLIENYQQGKKDYTQMLYLVNAAQKLNDTALARNITLDYLNHLTTIKEEGLYTEGNITFIVARLKSSNDKFFPLFYKHSRKVDATMHKNGYAKKVVDGIIMLEEVSPFLKAASQDTEPAWDQLFSTIKNKYNSEYADRNVLEAKLAWYKSKNNPLAYAKDFIQLVQKYGTDTTDAMADGRLNFVSYLMIFQHSNDNMQINTAIQWMEGVVRRYPEDFFVLDTYANLLYKAGRKEEALPLEEKALQLARKGENTTVIQAFEETIERMKKGTPTWPI